MYITRIVRILHPIALYRLNTRSARMPSLESPHPENRSFHPNPAIPSLGYGLRGPRRPIRYGGSGEVSAATVGLQEL